MFLKILNEYTPLRNIGDEVNLVLRETCLEKEYRFGLSRGELVHPKWHQMLSLTTSIMLIPLARIGSKNYQFNFRYPLDDLTEVIAY